MAYDQAASGISVTPSGLHVVTHSNVQDALADLDAAQVAETTARQRLPTQGILPQIPLAVNEWRLPYKQANGNIVMVSGQMILEPIWLPGGTLDGLAALFESASPNGNFRLVAFNASPNGHPNVCIANTGSIAVPANAAAGSTGLATAVTPALYWIGYVWVGTTGPTISQGGIAAQPALPWAAMPHGTGSLPAVSNGNDGTCASWTGQVVTSTFVGTTFAGTLLTNSNTPGIPPCIWLRYSVVS